MSGVAKRLNELQYKHQADELDDCERRALYVLHSVGIEALSDVMNYQGSDRWVVWAADSIVWTVRRLRAKEIRLALRGWGQLAEYKGRNGGYLGAALADCAWVLGSHLEELL